MEGLFWKLFELRGVGCLEKTHLWPSVLIDVVYLRLIGRAISIVLVIIIKTNVNRFKVKFLRRTVQVFRLVTRCSGTDILMTDIHFVAIILKTFYIVYFM